MIAEGKCGFSRTLLLLERVISKLKAISSNPKQSATIKNIWRLIGKMVDPCRPGDFNQALMELGANIRIPLNLRCSAYPGSPIDKSSEDRTEPEEKPKIYTKQNPEIRAQNSIDGELKSETRETKIEGALVGRLNPEGLCGGHKEDGVSYER
ncbi:hypothetical protein AAG906_015515 [Vitis piasezkii]